MAPEGDCAAAIFLLDSFDFAVATSIIEKLGWQRADRIEQLLVAGPRPSKSNRSSQTNLPASSSNPYDGRLLQAALCR